MRRRLTAVLLVVATCHTCRPEETPGGIRLLDGYKIRRHSSVDVDAWSIENDRGLRINCSIGPGGPEADPKKRAGEYSWHKQQTVNGHSVIIAMIPRGKKTDYDKLAEYKRKGSPPGNILIISFLLGEPKPDSSLDCSAKVADSEEIADMLLMILTADPSKGFF